MVEIRHSNSTVYCSLEDVRKLFRKEGGFGLDTNPSDAEVLDFIFESSADIDDYTRYAWRENTVVEETKTFDGSYKWATGRPAKLSRYPVRTPFDSASGDELKIWTGNNYEDWASLASKNYGRQEDYWVEEGHLLWVYRRFLWHAGPQLKLSYRYGVDRSTTTKTLEDGTTYDVIDGPRNVRRACAKLVAIDLVSSDQYTQLVPGGEGGLSPSEAIQRWEEQVYGTADRPGTLDRYKVDPAWVEAL